MPDEFVLYRDVPILVGSLGMLIALFAFVRGSQHPFQVLTAFVFSAVLCGSSVLASIQVGNDGSVKIETVRDAALNLTTLVETNTTAIESISESLEDLANRVSLASLATPPRGATPITRPETILLPRHLNDTRAPSLRTFCEDNPEICNRSANSGSIEVPRASFREFLSDTSKVRESLTKANEELQLNRQGVEALQKSLEAIQ